MNEKNQNWKTRKKDLDQMIETAYKTNMSQSWIAKMKDQMELELEQRERHKNCLEYGLVLGEERDKPHQSVNIHSDMMAVELIGKV